MPGAERLSECKELIELLNKQRNENRYYAAVCAAPAVVFEKHSEYTHLVSNVRIVNSMPQICWRVKRPHATLASLRRFTTASRLTTGMSRAN